MKNLRMMFFFFMCIALFPSAGAMDTPPAAVTKQIISVRPPVTGSAAKMSARPTAKSPLSLFDLSLQKLRIKMWMADTNWDQIFNCLPAELGMPLIYSLLVDMARKGKSESREPVHMSSLLTYLYGLTGRKIDINNRICAFVNVMLCRNANRAQKIGFLHLYKEEVAKLLDKMLPAIRAEYEKEELLIINNFEELFEHIDNIEGGAIKRSVFLGKKNKIFFHRVQSVPENETQRLTDQFMCHIATQAIGWQDVRLLTILKERFKINFCFSDYRPNKSLGTVVPEGEAAPNNVTLGRIGADKRLIAWNPKYTSLELAAATFNPAVIRLVLSCHPRTGMPESGTGISPMVNCPLHELVRAFSKSKQGLTEKIKTLRACTDAFLEAGYSFALLDSNHNDSMLQFLLRQICFAGNFTISNAELVREILPFFQYCLQRGAKMCGAEMQELILDVSDCAVSRFEFIKILINAWVEFYGSLDKVPHLTDIEKNSVAVLLDGENYIEEHLPNIINSDDLNILVDFACKLGQLNIFRLLVDKYGRTRICNRNEANEDHLPLFNATVCGQIEIIKYLLNLQQMHDDLDLNVIVNGSTSLDWVLPRTKEHSSGPRSGREDRLLFNYREIARLLRKYGHLTAAELNVILMLV